jgi:hypothetical protein
MQMVGFPKPSRPARRLDKFQQRQTLVRDEQKNKAIVRRRDRKCRFPLCGCAKLKLRLEVSHDEHKGMGGDPSGGRSEPDKMILLCVQRHQDGAVSRHHQTLRVRYLTKDGTNGPVAWDVDRSELQGSFLVWTEKTVLVCKAKSRWIEVARESAVGVCEPFTPRQREILEQLATMIW